MTKLFQRETRPVYDVQDDVTAVRIDYRVCGKLVKSVSRPISESKVVWSKAYRPHSQKCGSAQQQLGRLREVTNN